MAGCHDNFFALWALGTLRHHAADNGSVFEDIPPGATYSRPQLAKLWGYTSFHAIARGVVTPRNTNKIILFVTDEKQAFQEQYRDRLDEGTLSWEGPTDHFAEQRMVRAARSGDEIHLFHRDRHHTDFTYVGRLSLQSCRLHADRPSHFVFMVMESASEEDGTPAGRPWTGDETRRVVDDYFDMRSLFLQGRPFVKARYYQETARQTGRSTGSVEHKYMNISATLERLSLPWLPGYAPLRNFQTALLKTVEAYVEREWNDSIVPEQTVPHFAQAQPLVVEQPPEMGTPLTSAHPELERIARRFDPALRDERNRKLGLLGEQCVLESERVRLTRHGRDDLARKVAWISQELGDGAGYDIRSFDLDGQERFLEVKTTIGHRRTPFYLSRNEREFSREAPERFRIFRLYGWGTDPRAFLIKPPLESSLILEPTAYRASFG